jgi:enediyne biosynthesis protein E4
MHNFKGLVRCTILAIALLSFQHAIAQTPFKDVTTDAGIKHQFKVFEGTFGGGACVFDFDNDGWEDVYLTGGRNEDALYKNNGNGTFRNVFASAGLKTKIKFITQGVVSADVDRDGWRDLFITTITSEENKTDVPRAANLLFLNNGNGTFTDATKAFGLDTLLTFSTGAMFGDVNLDGYPDLYVGNYFQQFQGKLHVMNDAIIVSSKQMAKGLLLINKNGRLFRNEYERYGLDFKGFGFGGAFTDFDKDGDLDILVNHDFGYKAPPNRFLENRYPEKKLVDVGDKINMRLPMNAMGVAVGDYNNNGSMDYYVTNIRANPFMVNKGGAFENMNGALGTQINYMMTKQGGLLPVSWGANFADFDHDLDLDLFVANGCLNPYVMPNPNYYFLNDQGSFKQIGDSMGVADRGISRGSVTFDYDNDGDLDLLVVNQEPVQTGLDSASSTLLFRNDMPSKGNWLKVQLLGNDGDLQGIGSRIEIVAGGTRMMREIDGGSSHLSQSSVIAHFGLKDATRVDSIHVFWLGGEKQTIVNASVNQTIVVKQKPGRSYAWLLPAIFGFVVIAGVIMWTRRKKGIEKSEKQVMKVYNMVLKST